MSKEDLVFPGEPIEWVKDPSALEFPEVPRALTEGVKHDLVFPEGEEHSGLGSPRAIRRLRRPRRVFAFRALTAVVAVALAGWGLWLCVR